MGAKAPAKFDATEYFSLLDIALWSTSLRRDGDYQPGLHDGRCVVQSMKSTKPEVLTASLEGSQEETDVLRTLVSMGVRSVFREEETSPEVALYTLEATFAVDYIILKVPEADAFAKFVDFNCVHNAWPFWRQHVYDTLKRASLPVPVIPLFSGKASGQKRKKLSRITKRLEAGPTDGPGGAN